jgi:polysaccharide biosynthesis/export protein
MTTRVQGLPATKWLLILGIILLSSHAAERAERGPAIATKPDYVLQPQDVIKIQIFQEDDLTRELRISQEATVQLPLVGTVELKGKTIRQAEDLVRALYDRDFLVNPQVNIAVTEYWKRKVSVFGMVNKPGVVFFPQEQGLSLVEAIAQADGFTRLADKKRVTLRRTSSDGTTKTDIINMNELTKGEEGRAWPLQPGDIIDVPEKII